MYVMPDEDYDNTNDGSGDNDIINGGGSGSSNGGRVSVVI
jgi:hypothetical protein